MLLRSDGTAVACGKNDEGQCNIPQAEPCISYVGDLQSGRQLVVQVNFSFEDDLVSLRCSSLSGDEILSLNAAKSDLAWEIHKRIAHELRVALQSLQVVLPDGQLLAKVCRANPEATLSDMAKVNLPLAGAQAIQ